MTNTKAAYRLLTDIQKKTENWNEHSNFTIKGVKNLSVSDLDTLTLYANTFIKYGRFAGLMEPMGPIKAVLEKYGLTED